MSNMAKNKKSLRFMRMLPIVFILLIALVAGVLILRKNMTAHCQSESCISQKFASCSLATYSQVTNPHDTLAYHIYGKQHRGCNMLLTITDSPDKALIDHSMRCDFDNSQSLDDALGAATNSIANPLNKNTYACSGSLIRIVQSETKSQVQSPADTALTDYAQSLASVIVETMSNSKPLAPTSITVLRNSLGDGIYSGWQLAGPITHGSPNPKTIYYSADYECSNTNLMTKGGPRNAAIVVLLTNGQPSCIGIGAP
jgi:hypothetical protein